MAAQARRLEGEIDVKLAAFTKLCSSFEASYKLNSSDSNALGADQVRPASGISIVHASALWWRLLSSVRYKIPQTCNNTDMFSVCLLAGTLRACEPCIVYKDDIWTAAARTSTCMALGLHLAACLALPGLVRCAALANQGCRAGGPAAATVRCE